MRPTRLFLVTYALGALALPGCAATDSELFAVKASGHPPSSGGTFRLDESGDILNGRLVGDCASGCGNSGFGLDIVIAGDLDADGYDDVLFSAPGYAEDLSAGPQGGVYIVYGHSTWADEATIEPDAILEVNLDSGELSAALAGAGDVDGDGYSDFLVGAQQRSFCAAEALEPGGGGEDAGFGRVHLVYGGPSRLSGSVPIADVASTFVDEARCRGLGSAVASAGDLDGDGYGDFAAGGDTNFGHPSSSAWAAPTCSTAARKGVRP